VHTILVGDLEALPLAVKVEDLTERGYQVVAAGDSDALREQFHVAGHPFDLVVVESDLLNRIPPERMWGCLTRMRPRPRLIITTDFAPASTLDDTPFLAALCDAYLVRPFSLDDLGRSVQRVLAWGPRDPGPPGR
jgi:AmiR/NasT family two-component response regulator